MFGVESKKELMAEIARLEEERSDLLKHIEIITAKFDVYEKHVQAMPEDYKRGPWCKVCEFNASMDIPRVYDRRCYDTVQYCKRGMSCKHFTGKGEEKND